MTRGATKTRPGRRRLRRDREAQAVTIRRRLLLLAEGPTDEPATWRAVADRFGIDVYELRLPLSETGYYRRRDSYPYGSIISVNTAHDPSTQSAIWVHELAHHLLHEARPQLPYEEFARHSYDDETRSAAHQIACRVERLMLG